jgi:hypothetical protein
MINFHFQFGEVISQGLSLSKPVGLRRAPFGLSLRVEDSRVD